MEEKFILKKEGITSGPIKVRLAKNDKEIIAAQELRYDVFYTEYGANPLNDEMRALKRDMDGFDKIADHLIVIDTRITDKIDRIVGTYRLLRQPVAERNGGFYTKDEYDISPLLRNCTHMLELGRSCTHVDYRTRPVMQLLWQAIAEYITYYDNDVMFGCASFFGTNIEEIRESLSYLYHFHLAPEKYCPTALPAIAQNMNIIPKSEINAKKAFMNLPALIKGYLRLGGFIGNGAVIDTQFNTVDVCIIVKTGLLSERYKNHYDRKNQTTASAAAQSKTNPQAVA